MSGCQLSSIGRSVPFGHIRRAIKEYTTVKWANFESSQMCASGISEMYWLRRRWTFESDDWVKIDRVCWSAVRADRQILSVRVLDNWKSRGAKMVWVSIFGTVMCGDCNQTYIWSSPTAGVILKFNNNYYLFQWNKVDDSIYIDYIFIKTGWYGTSEAFLERVFFVYRGSEGLKPKVNYQTIVVVGLYIIIALLEIFAMKFRVVTNPQ